MTNIAAGNAFAFLLVLGAVMRASRFVAADFDALVCLSWASVRREDRRNVEQFAYRS
jgi:hypothetical protein